MGNLSNLYISRSFQSLIHLGTDSTAESTLTTLQDGYGNSIGIEVNTAGDLYLSGSLTASLQNGYMYVGNASGKTTTVATSSLVTNVNTGSLVSTSSFNSYTASTDIRLNNLESTSASVNTSITNINTATASLFTSASLALVTASFNTGTRNLTFTKGDNSQFSVNIPDISGSTGTGATLGANTFTGSQTISLSNGEFRITNPDFPSYGTVAFGLSNSSQGGIYFKQSGSLLFEGAPSDNQVTFYGTGSFTRGVKIGPSESFGNNLFIKPVGSLVGLGYPSGSETGIALLIGKAIDNTPTRFTQTNVTIDNSLVVTGSFTASLANGYVWVGDSNNKTTIVPTSSFAGTSIDTGSLVTTSSFNAYTSSNDSKVNALIAKTGSYATTASNTFTGNQTINANLIANKVSCYNFDSLFLGSQMGGTTANGTFFGYGSTDYTHTIGAYSGVFDNELQTYINSAGIEFRDFNGSSYPAWLKLGPNSGTNPAPAFVRGLNITGSLGHSGSHYHTGETYISGNIWVSGSVNLLNEGGNGWAFSSKALFLTNSVQTGVTVTSPIHFYKITKGDMYLTANVDDPGSSGSMNIRVVNTQPLNISSSNLLSTNAQTTINLGDFQVGTDPTANIYNGFKVDRSGNNYTIYNLATSSAILDIGAVDGTNFSYSTELLVTATPQKVTLQDFSIGDYAYHDWLTIPQNTGQNPAPQFNRGLTSTGSITIKSGSGDLYVHGHKQFNGGMFQNNTTLSGSAGVSQSIALPVTDLSYGVTIANNSQITITNAGVYNIQFSAQIEANAGADTVWIWFKKNGTNITDSATKVILPNNTAQTMTVNILVDAAANDYYELVWQNLNGYGKILSEVASGNIPLIPAVIVTVTQVR